MPEITTTVTHIQETVSVQAITVAPHVEARQTTVSRQTRDNDKPTAVVTEDIVFTGTTKDREFGQFVVVPTTLVERLRLTGWFRDSKDYDLISKTPFTDIREGKPGLTVVRLYDHTLFDVEGEPLPVGIPFNYIDGYVANDIFFLTGLVDHLKERNDVTLIPPRFGPEDKFIQNIPNYNRDGKRNRFVEFIWHPEVEVYRKFRKELGNGDHWARYVLAHTYMGNDAFRRPKKN